MLDYGIKEYRPDRETSGLTDGGPDPSLEDETGPILKVYGHEEPELWKADRPGPQPSVER